jgi:holo-[acyl-carrier protein] synthase
MIIGIGMDLVEVGRVERLLERHPERGAKRLFSSSEREYCLGCGRPAESFAARFAAKEAFFKALGTGWSGGAAWTEVEVLSSPSGAPLLRIGGVSRRLAVERGVERAHLSLTHTEGLAGACVVLEGSGEPGGALLGGP